AAVAIGQTWYHTFAWAGLALLGTFWLVRRAWRGPHRVFARWALASLGAEAIFVVGVLSGALTWSLRVDLHIYGRYYGSHAMILALVGVVAVIRGVARRSIAIAAA